MRSWDSELIASPLRKRQAPGSYGEGRGYGYEQGWPCQRQVGITHRLYYSKISVFN